MNRENVPSQIFSAIQRISEQPLGKKKNWYSSVAHAYEATRPGYPQQLIDEVVNFCRITASSNLLEIGSGPATATIAFAETGCRIKCLEPNSQFCAVAREKLLPYRRVEVLCSSLEESSLESGVFDVVLAANSMHWVSQEVGFQKVASALRNGGFLINLWNKELFPLAPARERLEVIYQEHAIPIPVYQDAKLQHQYLGALGELMVRSGRFRLVATSSVEVFCDYTADQYIALLSTFSPYLSLPSDQRDSLFAAIRRYIDDSGSMIPLSYLSAYHIGMKTCG